MFRVASAAGSPLSPTSAGAVAGDDLCWRYWVIGKQPRLALPIATAALFAGCCALLLFHSPIVSLGAAAAVLSSTMDSLVPLDYKLDSAGIHVYCLRFEWFAMPWSAVKSTYATGRGLKLSPFVAPDSATMEPFRGVLLRFEPQLASVIEPAIARWIGDAQ